MLYTVIAYRWGWTNETPQPQSCVTADLTRALAVAEEVSDNGGGKYGVALYAWPSDTERLLHKYWPSTYDEPEPFHNPRIDMFSSIGHKVHSAVTTGTQWDTYTAGAVQAPRPVRAARWVKDIVQEQMHNSAFSVALAELAVQRAAEGLSPVRHCEREALESLWAIAGRETEEQLANASKSYHQAVSMFEARNGPVPALKSIRELHQELDYLPLAELLKLIDQPAQDTCNLLVAEHRELLTTAAGSRHNHQAWSGGYLDHVIDGMNYARHIFALDEALGRPMSFSLSDALLVFFLHDLEKPWRILAQEDGTLDNAAGFDNKAAFKAFREQKLVAMGMVLTPAQHNALTYVEGEGDDYSSSARVMNELAAFCHKVDIWSARQCHDYPKAVDDEWTGARRQRTTL